ncbi:MAG: hypothetical protein HOC27_06890 [Phycisphaerae bacterium]|jgi:hypothetical protein|nr:hypothetical protein [Phycisphaerae bacterium]
MKDVVLDIVKHTAGLGFIENIKVTGTNDSTKLEAMDPDRTVILNAQLHAPAGDMVGEFGMGNLGFLNGVSNLPNYKDDGATVEVTRRERNGEDHPESLIFKDPEGNKDQYRFMSKQIVEQTMKTVTFKGASWNVTIEPAKAKVTELQQVASIYGSIEPTFNVKTEEGDLVFTVGSPDGGLSGRRTFARNVDGELTAGWSWPLSQVLSILKLGMSGGCVMKFSDQGALQIDVDSGIATYSYVLPAITK